jgi:hypothetical protein
MKVKGLKLCDLEYAMKHADIIVMLVNHKHFYNIGFNDQERKKIVLNFCGPI